MGIGAAIQCTAACLMVWAWHWHIATLAWITSYPVGWMAEWTGAKVVWLAIVAWLDLWIARIQT